MKMKFAKVMQLLQIAFGFSVLLIGIISLHQLHYLKTSSAAKDFSCSSAGDHAYAGFDRRALADRVEDALIRLAALQEKLETTIRTIDKNKGLRSQNVSRAEFRRFLDEEVAAPLYSVYVGLRLVQLPRADNKKQTDRPVEDPLINFFATEETRKYLAAKENRRGRANVHGSNRTHNTIGHACVLMKKELEEFMDYEIGSYCKDDWLLGQALMIGGCDPLPRRRCLARAPQLYLQPLPMNESLWRLPDDRNIRWNSYRCRSFSCLSGKNPNRGFSKCTGCFEMEKEAAKWVKNSTLRTDCTIAAVMAAKPGEIRIGLDVSVGTGSFAARMREWNVTVVSTALNIGAPFSETIALRGLIPLYVTVNQRLPFFDNTMDLIHTAVFLDGWIDMQLLDFVLFDWDRVLRPGGLLWIDKFFCEKKDLKDYTYMFLQFRYKKHRWVVAPKSGNEVYLSALLEKPSRTL